MDHTHQIGDIWAQKEQTSLFWSRTEAGPNKDKTK